MKTNTKKTIFVVDDIDVYLTKAKQALEANYRVLTMSSVNKMFELLGKITPDLILMDIEMPEMNGFEALEQLKSGEKNEDIPVMLMTGTRTDSFEARGFELGAVDFVSKPFSAPALLNRVALHLNMDEIIKERTERIKQMQNAIILVVADIVENRDHLTGGHIERTSMYVRTLLEAMLDADVYADEISRWDLDTVVSSARLHDVGKIMITDTVLNKNGKLTAEEFETMKKHTTHGEKIVEEIMAKADEEEAFLFHAKLFAAYHHERWDGNGYPRHLKGSEIPLQGRVMAVADVYDALVSARPYKGALSTEVAEDIIIKESGTAFDPSIVSIFATITEKFAQIATGFSAKTEG